MEEILINSHASFRPDAIIHKIEPLPLSGSDRRYWRLHTSEDSVIATFSPDTVETNLFERLTRIFTKQALAVPKFLYYDESKQVYFQEDLGNTSFWEFLQTHKTDEETIFTAYTRALRLLADFQMQGYQAIRADNSLLPYFDADSMLLDLHYFKYCYLLPAKIKFNEHSLEKEFRNLCAFLSQERKEYFMYRDFQSRNIMVHRNKLYGIDYQGGRVGALQYDIASLLLQARADLPIGLREDLLNYYINNILPTKPADIYSFKIYYNGFLLLRILQTLGAYGFRGYFEQKEHFLKSISFAKRNIAYWLDHIHFEAVQVPTLRKVLYTIIH